MANLYVALMHYPMKSLKGGVVATAITSLDVVDIARSCRTYDVVRYFIVHPLESQRAIVERILEFWFAERPSRREAVKIISVADDLEQCFTEVAKREGEVPLLWGTSARSGLPYPQIGWEEARRHLREERKPVLLLFGTGNGMAEELLWACDALLPPVREKSAYNHLSVRAAVAVILDRLKGDEG
jgi:hypothetical protein